MKEQIKICLKCLYVDQPPYFVECHCTVDGKPILTHFHENSCPKGYLTGAPQPQTAVPAAPCPGCGKPAPAPKSPQEALQRIQDELGGI